MEKASAMYRDVLGAKVSEKVVSCMNNITVHSALGVTADHTVMYG